jgi:simple sugar transport system ATP-binding protein
MPIFRNFCLGREPVRGWGPIRRFDKKLAKLTAQEKLEAIGIENIDVTRPVGTLSGGQRQAIAIARAAHFGATVLILDEPTSALGVKEAEIVLNYVERSKADGLGIILITHNVQHAFPIGDYFTILRRGDVVGNFCKGDLSVEELTKFMAGAIF